MSQPLIRMEVRGTRELRAAIDKIGDEFERELEAAVRSGALIVQNNAKSRAPYRTGNLRRSIHMETTERSREHVQVEVGTDLEYAAIHEFGGVITPKKAKALHFFIGAKAIFTRAVHMPARPYLRPALDENKAKIITEVREALRAVLQKIGKEMGRSI